MKNIPVRYFEYREQDNSTVEGWGGEIKTSWLLPKRELDEHAYNLKTRLLNLKGKFDLREEYNSDIPIVIRAQIHDGAIAKSYRNNIQNLLCYEDSNVIGFDNKDEILISIKDSLELERILERIENTKKYEVGISAVRNIGLFQPKINFSEKSGYENVAKVKLFNFREKYLNLRMRIAFDRFCRENEIESKPIEQYGQDLFIYAIKGLKSPTLDTLKKFEGIYEVSNMPIYVPENPDIELHESIPQKTPDPRVDYSIIGVLDSGITKNEYTKDWLVDERRTSHYSEEDINQTHGTLVAGRLLYGPELDGKTEENGVSKLIDFTVFPDTEKQQVYEYELIAQIEETITNNQDIEVWNLSLGTSNEINPLQFSDFAIALDDLQVKYDVLICKSVGNCENYKFGLENGRIAQSADSVLSLVVGSIAHEKNEIDLAEIDHPSPFTRFGPAPAGIIKPDLVSYGGNIGKNTDGKFVNNGVMSISPDGTLMQSTGTSFATPKVTSLAASLGHNLLSDFDPLLIKALLIHNAKHPDNVELDIESKVNQLGYGLPSNISDMLFNDENEITLVLRDKIEKGKYVEIFDFPYPQLIEKNLYRGKITITLVTKPILEATQGVEYCQSELEVSFGSYDYLEKRNTDNPRIKNDYKMKGNKNFLIPSIYSKTKIKDFDEKFPKERILLSYYQKYRPVKKWVINLDEFTPSNTEKYLTAPKNWFLKIQPFFRNFSENKFRKISENPSIDYCLLISISDPSQNSSVNAEVQEKMNKSNFPNRFISIKPQSSSGENYS